MLSNLEMHSVACRYVLHTKQYIFYSASCIYSWKSRDVATLSYFWSEDNFACLCSQYNRDLLLTFVESSPDNEPSMEMTLSGGGGGVTANDWLGDTNQSNGFGEGELGEGEGEGEAEEEIPPQIPEFKGHKFVLIGMERLPDRHKFAKSQRWVSQKRFASHGLN